MFSSSTYQQRRQKLADQLSDGLILIPGNNEAPMNYTDNVYPFRQDSNFRYFGGINKPGFVLTIDASSGHSKLYGNDISLDHIIWMGDQPSVKDLAAAVGIDDVGSLADLATTLAGTQQQIHYLPPYREERFWQLQQWLGQSRAEIAQNVSGALVRAVIAQRSIKTDEEVVQMEIAVNTTRRMHHAAMNYAAPGMFEYEVAGFIEGIAIQGNGRLSYPAIVTRNGHILHNHYHGNELEVGDLLLIDAGAETPSGYAGDITRTFCIGRELDAKQKAIYELVKKAEEDVIADLRPQVAYRDYHAQAGRIIAAGLKELGLMKGDPAEAVAEGAHALFMPHGLGHHIGLDVHDMEDLGEDLVGYDDEIKRSQQFGTSSLRLGKKLEAGYVITVEPGIYFIPALIDRWEAERKFADFINYDALKAYYDFGGIRIEDNVLITPTGSRVLGEPIRK